MWIVVAAIVALSGRCATEFGTPYHERIVKHAASLQVAYHLCHRTR